MFSGGGEGVGQRNLAVTANTSTHVLVDENDLERIGELDEKLASLVALLLLRERALSDNGAGHGLGDVARELGAEDLLDR